MRLLTAVFLGGVLGASPALAQAPPAPEPPKAPAAKAPAKPPAAKAPEYDVKAEVTIKGVVEDFHESKMRGDHPGLHFILKTEAAPGAEPETVEVHACPVRFMSDLEFTIEKGDAITVLGSRPEAGGVVIAREITKGQMSLILRDAKTGEPIWTGR
jgi:hypothetical protein